MIQFHSKYFVRETLAVHLRSIWILHAFDPADEDVDFFIGDGEWGHGGEVAFGVGRHGIAEGVVEVVVVDVDFFFGTVGVDDGLGFSEEAFEGRADGFGVDGVAVGAVSLEGGAGEDFPVEFELFVVLSDPLFALGWGAGEGDGFWFRAGFGGEVDGLAFGIASDLSGGDGDDDFIDPFVDGDRVL